MELYWKTAAAVLLTVILVLAVGRQEKDMGTVLSMAVCAMAGTVVISYLEPVMDLLWKLEDMGGLGGGMLGILLKAVGIALVTQMARKICTDAGNGSLGAMLELLGSAVILYLSIPLFDSFLTLLREILGEI